MTTEIRKTIFTASTALVVSIFVLQPSWAGCPPSPNKRACLKLAKQTYGKCMEPVGPEMPNPDTHGTGAELNAALERYHYTKRECDSDFEKAKKDCGQCPLNN